MNSAHEIVMEKSERSHLEDLGTNGNIILKWFLDKEDGKVWTGYIWIKVGHAPCGLLKTGNFLTNQDEDAAW